MNVRYNARRSGLLATNYVCVGRGRSFGDPLCQSILGMGIDAAVGNLLIDCVTPMVLELALAVQKEITARLDEADRLRHRQVERAGCLPLRNRLLARQFAARPESSLDFLACLFPTLSLRPRIEMLISRR